MPAPKPVHNPRHTGRTPLPPQKLVVPSAKAGFDWAATRISVYTQLVQASLANFSHLWSAGVVEEAWAGLFPRAAAAALDDATATRDKALRPLLALLPCIAATRCPAVASSAAVGIMTRLQVLEHAPGHFAAALGEGLAGAQAADVAEALHLPPEAAHALRPLAPRLADFLRELLGELGRLGDGASDSASMRNLGAFLAELASAAPTALLPHVSSLHRHLDSPAYALRNAVVTALATLLAECFRPDAGSAASAGEQGASAPPSVSVRDTLLDILITRVMDKHALARAAALRAWASVVAAGALPMARCGDVAALAADRLRDTSSITRRAALALLCACMEHNPFAGTLVRRPFLAFAREAGAWLATHTTGDTRLGVFKVLQGVLGAEEARQVCPPPTQEQAEAEAEAEAGEAAASGEQDSEHPDTAAQLQRLQYAACGGRLLDALDVAMPRVAELLTSETSSDVIAAVRALCVARAFGVGGSHSGLQAALNLVWSSEPTVVAAVTATFAHLYLTEPAEAAKARGEEGGHALGSRRSQVVADDEDEGEDEGEDGGGKGKAGGGSSLKRKGGVLVGVDGSPRLPCPPATAAANLIALAAGATAAVAASLEQLLRVLAGRGEVSSDVTDALWDCVGRGAVALGAGAGPTDPPVVGARTAMSILHMLTPVMPAIVNSETGLTRLRFVLKRPRDGATFDYHLAREAAAAAAAGMCTVLGGAPGTPAAIAAAESVDVARGAGAGGLLATQATRSAAVQSLLGSLVALVVGGWDGGIVDDPAWFGAAGAALDAVFTLSPRPEAVVGSLLHTMLLTAFPPAPTEDDAEGEAAPATATAAIGQDAHTWSGDALASAAAEGAVPTPLLARLLFVGGHAALKLLVHAETLGRAVKRIRGGVSDKLVRASVAAKAKKRGKRLSRRLSRGSVGSAASSPGGGGGALQKEDIEEQLGGGGVTADAEEEAVTALAAVGIVQDALLGLFGPLLQAVVADEGGAFGPASTGGGDDEAPPPPHTLSLHRAAMLSLTKCMAVSRVFCEEQLPLLFTALERSPDATLRITLVVALGDLTVRFPNLLEPWNARLYRCLRDPHVGVRRNALNVLSHLVLNDMIKVRGTLAEIAALLADTTPGIAATARVFFQDLSRRTNNPVYNLLPDTLSCLWQHPALDPPAFRAIMRFLLTCVNKEKHIDGLVEKFAHRFAVGDDTATWQANAFCLAQLAPRLGEKGVRKLVEAFPVYKRCLGDAGVAEAFATLVTAAQKVASAKGGAMTAAVEEWATAIDGAAAGASSQQDVQRRAAAALRTKTARDAAAASAEQAEEAVAAALAAREAAAAEAAATAKRSRASQASARAAAARRKAAAQAAASDSDASDSDGSVGFLDENAAPPSEAASGRGAKGGGTGARRRGGSGKALRTRQA